MSFKWFRKNEQGSVMVIVAVALTALLGITGLAVDFGSLAMTKQELQNAADAAALAAGQEKVYGNAANAQTVAAEYIQANGYTPGDGATTYTMTTSGNTITVTVTTKKNVGFSAVLTGRKVEDVSATAVVEIMNPFANYPYALFASEEGGIGLVGNANKVNIYGDIHSNSGITMSNTDLHGTATALGDINIDGGTQNHVELAIEMPSVQSIVDMVKGSPCRFDGNVKIKKNEGGFQEFLKQALEKYPAGYLPGPGGLNIYVNGDLEIHDDAFHNCTYPINLVVKGSIKLGGTPLTSTEATPLVLISETGSVEVDGQGTTGGEFYGIIFAPGGDVNLNGGNTTVFNGSVYAKNIKNNGAGVTISYNSAVDEHLPKGKIRLVG